MTTPNDLMVSLDIAKMHARIDGDDEDPLLLILLQGAIEHCREYLNRPLFASEQEKGDDVDGIVMNADIQTAILLVFSWRYAHRENQDTVPIAAHRLLNPYRKYVGL